MSDISNNEIMELIETRSAAKIAEALPHVKALITILDPENSILQHNPIGGSARSVHNAASTFKRIADQLSGNAEATDPAVLAPAQA